MKAVLDAGAFVAIEKRDRQIGAILRVLQRAGVPLWTSSAVVAQVWRDGRKQALLARMLVNVDVRPLASDDDKRTGELLAAASSEHVIDAHVVLLTDDGDRLLTSDPDDLERLLRARRVDADVVAV